MELNKSFTELIIGTKVKRNGNENGFGIVGTKGIFKVSKIHNLKYELRKIVCSH